MEPVQPLGLLVRIERGDERVAGDLDHAVAGGQRRGAGHEQPEGRRIADAPRRRDHERDAGEVAEEASRAPFLSPNASSSGPMTRSEIAIPQRAAPPMSPT